jgi:serine/threonine protein kinase
MAMQYKKSLNSDINILGKGTYGCVIPKILKCNKNNYALINKGTTQISKLLLDKKEFYKEINNTLFVNRYDKGDTSILLDDTCIITKDILKEILLTNGIDKKYIDKCNIMLPNTDNLYQIIYNKKGITLRNLIYKNPNIEMPLNQFIRLTFNLFKGIKRFNKLHFIHFDIKDDNIIYLPDEKKFIFIDFGLSKTYKILLKTRTLEYYSSSPRYYYSAEILIFSILYKKEDYNYHDLYNIFKNKYEEELKTSVGDDIIANIIKYNYNNHNEIYENELKQLFNSYYFAKDPYAVLKQSFDKIDIYSLAITLYRCIKKYNIHNNYVYKIYKYIIFPCLIINPLKRISINKIIYLYGKNIL